MIGVVRVQVLIVDDNPKIIDLFKNFFELKGIDIDFLSSGKDVLEVAKEKNVKFIILDMAMPNYDGFYALKKLKEDNYNMANVIVLTAAELSNNEKNEIREYGVKEFLEKPVRLNYLLNIIESG